VKNPWTKKNPWMSLWLSGANAAMGQARGQVAAAQARQSAALMQDITSFWLSSMFPAAASRGRSNKRRR